jgi:hypothetical protein
MNFKTIIIAGISALSTSAHADTLITPTLWAQEPIYFACNLTNVGDGTRTVTTRIVNGTNGSIMLDKTVKLAPRFTMNTTLKGLAKPGGPIYCEFTFQGSKNDFRGVAKIWPGPSAPNSSDITAISAQ